MLCVLLNSVLYVKRKKNDVIRVGLKTLYNRNRADVQNSANR